MTGIGYFQNLQAIHFTSSSSQRQNKPGAVFVLFCCETTDVGQEGVWWGAQGMLLLVNFCKPDMGKDQNLRPCRKTRQFARRFTWGNTWLQVQLYLLWSDDKTSSVSLWHLKSQRPCSEGCFNCVTTCVCKLHEHEVPPKKLHSFISQGELHGCFLLMQQW